MVRVKEIERVEEMVRVMVEVSQNGRQQLPLNLGLKLGLRRRITW